MPKYAFALPVAALGNSLICNETNFRKELEKLNRKPTLELIAKLNLIIGDNPHDFERQERILHLLWHSNLVDSDSFQRIKSYQSKHGPHWIFSRTHAFELYRAVTLWSKDFEQDTVIVDRQRFGNSLVRAILMSYELFSARLEIPSLSDSGDTGDRFLFHSLRAMREKSLMAPGVTNPLAILGRSRLLMDKFFFKEHQNYQTEFEKGRMTLQSYRDCATAIYTAVATLYTGGLDSYTSMSEIPSPDFSIESLCLHAPHMQGAFETFLRLESLPVEQWAQKFAGQSEKDFIDLRDFREKPFLALSKDKYHVLDLTLLAERATYGPFFYPIGGAPREKFKHFGEAFEDYIQKQSIQHSETWKCTVPPICSHLALPPKAGVAAPEIADLSLSNGQTCILAQIKGVWLDDKLIRLSPEEFWQHVQAKYSSSGGGGSSPRLGSGQLAYAIKGILTGQIKEASPFVLTHQKIIPVLIVHDAHLVIPHFGVFLNRDFWKSFDSVEAPKQGWLEYENYRIYSPIILSVVEFENFEHLGDNLNIFDLLIAYSDSDKGRHRDLREFLSNQNSRSIERSDAMKTGKMMIDEMRARLFKT